MLLSILIPSLHRRQKYLSRLLAALSPQAVSGVEILIHIDSGEIGRGPKRNNLMQQARGKYVAFVDDDDLVAPWYVEELMAGIEKGVDVVSIKGKQSRNGIFWRNFVDNPAARFGQIEVEGIPTLTFGVQHLDAVKREIALTVPFQDIKFGEDRRWGLAIQQSGLVRTWHQVVREVYLYEFRSVKDV